MLAAGQFEGVALEEFLDAQHLRGFQHFALDHFVGRTGLAQRRGDVLEDGHGRVIDELLIHHRHVAQAHRALRDIDAVHQDPAGVRLVQPGHQTHETGFAGQRAPQQNVEGSGFETQTRIIDPGLALDGAADVLQG
ncbi:hypothetical protein D3C87_1315060 [compost metagenome]